LDKLAIRDIKPFVVQCASYIKAAHKDAYQSILESQSLTDQNIAELHKAAEEFTLIFSRSQ